MSIEEPKPIEAKPKDPLEPKHPRVWPAVLMCVTFWAFWFLGAKLELDLGTLFFSRLGACGLALLLGIAYWWTSFRIPLWDRFVVAMVFVVGVVTASLLSHETLGGFGMYLFGIPVTLTAASIGLVLARQSSSGNRRLFVSTAMVLAFVGFTLIRMEGVRGNADTNFAFRWAPTAEEQFLSARQPAVIKPEPPSAVVPLEVGAGDWTEFRGRGRDGVVTAGDINTDWINHPPRLLWKKRLGPAWSSVIVVAGRLFTQEQRGKQEAVVCYDALSGEELWSCEEKARYEDAVSGAGPRATPTFAGGRIFAMGSSGVLMGVDAATGKKHWSREVLKDSEGQQQMWGFSSSPLVIDGLVIVFGGGDKRKSLLAYNAASGELVWSADAGQMSFSSPQLLTIGDKRVVLFVGEFGLQGFDPASGKLEFQWGEKRPQEAHSLQPHVLSLPQEERIYVATTQNISEARLHDASQKWDFESGWTSKDLKPDFNDFVVFQDHAFGFDREMFACLNLANGKRAWKARTNYGHGQVILLQDKALLLVLTETGEAVLLTANPKKHEELGRFQAIEGKTWNHPVIVDGRLFVRNAEEMACYDVSNRPSETALTGG